MQKQAEDFEAEFRINKMGGMILSNDNDENRRLVEHCYRTTDTMVNPIIDWTDDDVWEFLRYYDCRSNPLYECGFKRIGCIGCPLAGGKSQKREFQLYPKYRALYVRAFDRMVERRKERNKETSFWRDGESVMRWWVGDDPLQITLDDYNKFMAEETILQELGGDGIAKNKLQFFGTKKCINEMLKAVKGEKRLFDFNKIIPMPNELDIESGSRTFQGLDDYKKFIAQYSLINGITNIDYLNIPEKDEERYLESHKSIAKDEWELGKRAFQNNIKYQAYTWFEWCTENWETKWNAMNGVKINSSTIEFETAWAAPKLIIQKLHGMYPDIKIEHFWSDENLGYNIGHATYFNGEITEKQYKEGSKEAYEFAAEIWDTSLEENGLVFNEKRGTYEYHKPEESEGMLMKFPESAEFSLIL